MILIDKDLKELSEIELDIDAEFGTSKDSTNDFEMTDALIQNIGAAGFYIPGTEIGGFFEYDKTKSSEDITTLKGFTWRGLLTQSILIPPVGSDYLSVSGEANDIIQTLLLNVLGGFFTVSSEDSGLTISNYQFPLYINTLDGIEGMLEEYGYKLKITANKVASGQPIQVKVEAVEAETITGTYNEDNGIPMTFVRNNMGINHLLCAGKGELQDRVKVNLYINQNGAVSTSSQYYFGFDERTAFYDYSSAESEDDLITNGTKRLKELASSKTLSLKAPEESDLTIGDLVTGQFPDGTIITKPVVQKIYKISGGLLTTEIKIKGEN